MKQTLEQLAKEERKAYFREWRQKNKDKVKKHQEDYWKRRATQKVEGREE